MVNDKVINELIKSYISKFLSNVSIRLKALVSDRASARARARQQGDRV